MTRKYTNYSETRNALLSGAESCLSLVNYYLNQAKSTHKHNAYIELFDAKIKERASLLDQKLKTNPAKIGKLFGMVIAIKDVLCYENHEVTAASNILKGFKSLYTATAIQRLINEDALIIGRLNCDEFGMGSSNENSIYGPTLNAADTNKVPGGSSGASAVAIQLDTCLVALGSDTGGSVRQPAAFCGVMGLKPSYSRISRYGLIAYASSFDQIGIMGNSVEDLAITLEVMAGEDPKDSTSSQRSVPAYSKKLLPRSKYKIAYWKTAIDNPSLDSNIRNLFLTQIERLKKEGHTVEEIDFRYMDYAVPAYYVLTTAEASSNLSRYSGVHYGNGAKDAKSLEELYTQTRTAGFGKEVKRRIMLGTFVLSAGYYDAYYSKAQKVRRLIKTKLEETFASYDFIMLPTTPSTAFPIGEPIEDPTVRYLGDIYTVIANLAGVPAISIPLPVIKTELPVGIQFMAATFEEEKLLAFSKYFSQII